MMSKSFQGSYSIFRFLIVLFVFLAVASAQITFSRNWARGKYPSDEKFEEGVSAEYQRVARSGLPKRLLPRHTGMPNGEYVSILMSSKALDEVLNRIKDEPVFSPGPAPVAVEFQENSYKK